MIELATRVEEIERGISEALSSDIWVNDSREAHARVATIFRGLGMHRRQYLNEKA